LTGEKRAKEGEGGGMNKEKGGCDLISKKKRKKKKKKKENPQLRTKKGKD